MEHIRGFKTFVKAINRWVGGNWNKYRLNSKYFKQLTKYILQLGQKFKRVYRLTNAKDDPITKKKVGDTITLNLCSTSNTKDFHHIVQGLRVQLVDIINSKKCCIYEIHNAFGVQISDLLNKRNKDYFEYQKEVIIFGQFVIKDIKKIDNKTTLYKLYSLDNGKEELENTCKDILDKVYKYEQGKHIDRKTEDKLYRKTLSY